MIQWEKYFDKIICINYIQFKTRKELMEYELRRLGITHSSIFEWQTSYKGPIELLFHDLIVSNQNNKPWDVNSYLASLAHINAIENAYYNGCKNVLIIEDDIRFLKDLKLIEKILQAKPTEEQYDLLMYDKFILYETCDEWNRIKRQKENCLNNYYIKNQLFILSAGCYCLSRNGMELILNLVKNKIFTTPDCFFNRNEIKNNLRKYCTNPNLAVQVTFTDCGNLKGNGSVWLLQSVYRNQNVDFNDYMMRMDGAPYNYNDTIDIKEG